MRRSRPRRFRGSSQTWPRTGSGATAPPEDRHRVEGVGQRTRRAIPRPARLPRRDAPGGPTRSSRAARARSGQSGAESSRILSRTGRRSQTSPEVAGPRPRQRVLDRDGLVQMIEARSSAGLGTHRPEPPPLQPSPASGSPGASGAGRDHAADDGEVSRPVAARRPTAAINRLLRAARRPTAGPGVMNPAPGRLGPSQARVVDTGREMEQGRDRLESSGSLQAVVDPGVSPTNVSRPREQRRPPRRRAAEVDSARGGRRVGTARLVRTVRFRTTSPNWCAGGAPEGVPLELLDPHVTRRMQDSGTGPPSVVEPWGSRREQLERERLAVAHLIPVAIPPKPASSGASPQAAGRRATARGCGRTTPSPDARSRPPSARSRGGSSR